MTYLDTLRVQAIETLKDLKEYEEQGDENSYPIHTMIRAVSGAPDSFSFRISVSKSGPYSYSVDFMDRDETTLTPTGKNRCIQTVFNAILNVFMKEPQ